MKVLLLVLFAASGMSLFAVEDIDMGDMDAMMLANDDLDLAAAEAEADLEIAATCDCALDIAACRAQGYSCADYCEGRNTPDCATYDDYTKAEIDDAADDVDIFES